MGRHFNILVVDDTPKNIQLAIKHLEAPNYQFLFATSGVKALEIVELQPIDLILLDIMMPELDGYETCERLKADERFCDIPVIFLTARSELEDMIKGFDLGAVDFVTKPFKAPELRARVATHINLRYQTEKAQAQEALLQRQFRNAAIEQLTTNLAHQWRQPLTIIGAIVDECQHAPEFPKSLTPMTQEIQKEIVGLSEMIDRFGSYFALDAPSKRFDLHESLSELLAFMKGACEFDSIELILKRPEAPLMMLGVESELIQVLLILLNNAREAALKAPAPYHITFNAHDDGAHYILEIIDSGSGIEEGLIDGLFDPYTTTKYNARSVGLSLYMARIIIERRFGGSIRAHNHEKTQGACFTIVLPHAE